MLRKAFCIMVMLLTLPAMASAYNCWYVTRSASPTSFLPNVTAPGNTAIPGYNTLTGSTTTNMTALTSALCATTAPTSATFGVTAPAGYTVSSVKIDGVVQAPASSYTINKGTRIGHTIAVAYTAQRYTITTTPAAGGIITPSVSVASGASATINITPGTGYQLASVTIDGTEHTSDATFTDVQTNGSYTFTNVTAPHSLTASFAAAPTATVRISTVGGTVNIGTPIALDGTPSTASNPAATWTWTVSPTTGITPTTASGKTATFTPSALGTYTFTLTAGNTGLTSDPSASVSFTVQNPVDAANNICLNCHATNDNFPGSTVVVAGYNASPHAGAKSCQDCHNPGGTQSHHYNVTRLTVDTLTFKALTTAGPAAKGEYFCLANGCHVPTNIWGRDLSQSSHFANIQNSQCSSCHGTEMHTQDGEFDNKCGVCHANTLEAGLSKHATAITEFSCRSCHTGTVGYGYNATPTVVGSSMSFTRPSSARASKHRPETFKYATSDSCATCHAGVRTEFRATAHWNSHLESGPEFAGGAVNGQLNANESWTTTEDGAAVTCYKRCHFKPNLGQDPKATDSNTNGGLRPGKDECVACHDPHKLVATYQTTCMTCHNGSKHGKVPNEFWNSAHWNNHLESGPEFTNQMNSTLTTGTSAAGGTVTYSGTSDGVLNANDSYTTTENGSVVTCAYRCHFRPGMGPLQNVPGALVNGHATGNVSYTDTLNGVTYTRPGGNACMACHDAHGLEAGYQTCLTCHSGSKHGKVPNEFWASKHWINNLETGSEFANQMDITTVGANVKNNGGTVPGVLNANDSYTTTENGTTVTCAYRCHFRPGMYPDTVTPPSNYINPISKKAITYVMYSSPYGAGKFYRPGGNACMACHDAHGLEANARSTCYTCHAGGNHGWSVKAFEKSSHFTGTYAIYDGIGGPTGEACTACHNAHSLEAEFANLSTASTLHSAGLATGCQRCHEPGQTYGIFNADRTGKAPHFSPDVLTTAYVTSRTTCADCHSHNNTINSGWAEGGHGSLSSPAFTGDPAENFKTMGVAGNYQSDPSLRNCVRCHTAKGAMNFVTSGFTSVAAVGTADDNTSEPLVCSGCHNNVDKGTLPLANFTSQHNGGGYTARYGYKNRLANNTLVNTAIYLGNMKNSNICAPCHSQRASGQEIKDVFALGSFKQYSAGSTIYPHIAQPAAILAGKGAYEFVPFTAPVEGHITNAVAGSNGTGSTQGPCVACHMNGLKPHNLEIDGTSFTKNCSKCHGSSFNQAAVDAAKAEFDAAVAVVGNMLVANGISIDGINPLPERTAFDMSLGATTNRYAVAEKNMGAWFNWYLFSTSDPAAFAHNPAYAKKMIQDTIDYLAHGTVTGSIADVPEAAGLNLGAHPAQGSNTCTSCHNNQSVAAADCIGCHDISRSATTADLDNDGVRAIMPEFNKRSHHVTGGTPTNAQCAVCHAEGTASNPTRTSSYHMSDGKVYLRDVDHAGAVFAWDGTNHTAMDNFCFACHDADGAADVATITALNPAATAMNPFADTLTNGYDMVARTGVVDVKTAFDPANASHHAVLAQKYQYRFSNRDNAEAWKTRNSSTRVIADSELAAGKIVDGETVEFPETGLTYDPAGPEDGGEATLYEADKFVATYMPLGATENVGDNSQLHCGDCHTVGQWKANSSTNADGTASAAAIGAHGSANEYMLRNALGTDALHNARTLVCFNCHKTTFPTTAVTNYNQVTGYATAHSVSAFHGQCIAESMLQIGATNRLSRSERVDRQATWSTADGVGGTNLDSGNITGISCTNCHNSGLRAGWGGIHGGNNTYTDGLGNTQQTYRFMPGMGNYRYAPPGGWDGKDLTDPTLVTKAAAGVGANKGMGGCYTNSALTGSDPNTGYGACSHHGTSTAKSYKGAVPVDVTNGTQRDSYGGGTTGSPTAAEPTVREATGGNTLVTRPLKY